MRLRCSVSDIHSELQKRERRAASQKIKDTEYIQIINIIFKSLTFLMARVPQKSEMKSESGLKNHVYCFLRYFFQALIICNSLRIICTLSVIPLENIGMLLITCFYSFILIYIIFHIIYFFFNGKWIVEWRNAICEYETVKQTKDDFRHLNKFGKGFFIYICIHQFCVSLVLMVILPLLYPEHGQLFYAFVFPVTLDSVWYDLVLILNFIFFSLSEIWITGTVLICTIQTNFLINEFNELAKEFRDIFEGTSQIMNCFTMNARSERLVELYGIYDKICVQLKLTNRVVSTTVAFSFAACLMAISFVVYELIENRMKIYDHYTLIIVASLQLLETPTLLYNGIRLNISVST